MNNIAEYRNKIAEAERQITATNSIYRKRDLQKYIKRLKRELVKANYQIYG